MRKLFAIILLAALAFAGCGKNDDGESGGGNGGSTKSKLVGLWLCTGFFEQGETYEPWAEDYHEYAMELTSDRLYTLYNCVSIQFRFSNGYIYGCTKSDFDKGPTHKYTIEDNVLFVSGVRQGTIVVKSNDMFYLTDDDGDTDVYSRVKGFK